MNSYRFLENLQTWGRTITKKFDQTSSYFIKITKNNLIITIGSLIFVLYSGKISNKWENTRRGLEICSNINQWGNYLFLQFSDSRSQVD